MQRPDAKELLISIHALLAESDPRWEDTNQWKQEISIHALLAESDRYRRPGPAAGWPFLSTLSLRRATPNSPAQLLGWLISIHALLAESDPSGTQKPTR